MVPLPSVADFHRKERKEKADARSPPRKQRGSRSACMDWFLLRCVFSSSCERGTACTYYDPSQGYVLKGGFTELRGRCRRWRWYWLDHHASAPPLQRKAMLLSFQRLQKNPKHDASFSSLLKISASCTMDGINHLDALDANFLSIIAAVLSDSAKQQPKLITLQMSWCRRFQLTRRCLWGPSTFQA